MNIRTQLRIIEQMRAETLRARRAAFTLSNALKRPANALVANYLPDVDEHLTRLEQIKLWTDLLDTDLGHAADALNRPV